MKKYNMTIEETIKQFFDEGVDGVSFMPINSDLDLDLKGFRYNSRAKYETYNLGHKYHILIYKVCDDGYIQNLDNFEAILTAPYTYVSNLIKCDFFGVVSKKTTRSKKFVSDIHAQMKSSIRNGNKNQNR